MRTKLWIALLALPVAACTEENPALTDGFLDLAQGDGAVRPEAGVDCGAREAGRDAGPVDQKLADLKPADAFVCAAGTFLACKSATLLLQCNSTGTGTVLLNCSPYLCDATNKRCTQCDPKSAAYCVGNDLYSCTAEGLVVKTTCPSGCQAGACTGCVSQTYYYDGDGDGYGNPSVKVSACAQPAKFVANALDCDDADALAHPGQTQYFNVPTKGTGAFDYNCDKIEEKQDPALVNCIVSGMTCVGDGWVGKVPACGTSGTWAKCNKQGPGPSGCGTTTSSKIQSCR